MATVTFTRNELADHNAAEGRRFEEEIREGVAEVGGPWPSVGCRILSWGRNAVSVQYDLRGWLKIVAIPFDAAPGAVRRTTSEVLRARLAATILDAAEAQAS